MISICAENVDDRAEEIFVYASFENRTLSATYYYKINGQYVRKHKLNEALHPGEVPFDVSIDRQQRVHAVITEDIEHVMALCAHFDRPMPTEMKLRYDAVSKKIKTNISYDNKYSDDPELSTSAYDVADQWFMELKKGAEGA